MCQMKQETDILLHFLIIFTFIRKLYEQTYC